MQKDCIRFGYESHNSYFTIVKGEQQGLEGMLSKPKHGQWKTRNKSGGSNDPPLKQNFNYGTSFTLLQSAGRANYTNRSVLLLNPHGNVGSCAAILVHPVGDYALCNDVIVWPNDVCELDV